MLHRIALMLCLAGVMAPALKAQELAPVPAQEHANWHAIGRVNNAGYRTREMCSGTLIAPDKVLTAAHCLAGVDGVGPSPSEITFVAGWLRGDFIDSARGASIWIPPQAYAQGALDIRFDIAVLTLERAMDIAPIPPLPRLNAETQARFAILGYTSRRPHMLSAAFTCQGKTDIQLLRLTCPVEPGNSGGPVLTQVDGAWHVAAAVSARSDLGTLAVPIDVVQAD